MLLATIVAVVCIATSLVSALRATKLRWQLFEGYRPFALMRMQRHVRIWARVWFAAVIVGVVSTLGALAQLRDWIEGRVGFAPSILLIASCAGLVVVWLVVMVDGFRKYRKSQHWDFLGSSEGSFE